MAWIIGRVLSGGGHHEVAFYDVISVQNLLSAWKEFSKGKRKKLEVAEFELRLEENLFTLHRELTRGVWKPKPYEAFFIQDPKLRRIHKASVRDRVLFQAVYRKLYQVFDREFIYDSYASRLGKGTHAGARRFEEFARKVTLNYRRRGFVLKCDIRKFFDSVHHATLLSLLKRRVGDPQLFALLQTTIASFETEPGKGLPLGNVTSQLFANVYLNELDQFVKHERRVRHYARYCDDFVIMDESPERLRLHVAATGRFLDEKLSLELHPRKVEIRKIGSGVDFLGYVALPHFRVLRTRTKWWMFKRLALYKEKFEQGELGDEFLRSAIRSYFGMLSHCKGRIEWQKVKAVFGEVMWRNLFEKKK